jgi:hypothetical protein
MNGKWRASRKFIEPIGPTGCPFCGGVQIDCKRPACVARHWRGMEAYYIQRATEAREAAERAEVQALAEPTPEEGDK